MKGARPIVFYMLNIRVYINACICSLRSLKHLSKEENQPGYKFETFLVTPISNVFGCRQGGFRWLQVAPGIVLASQVSAGQVQAGR